MLCSKCSEIIRPVVAVDIDGTLGDYHGHFIDFAERYIGRDLHRNYSGGSSFRLWFQTANYIGKDQYRAIKLAYRQGGMKRSMPMYEGADELILEILSHDVELWFTTTRPYLSLDTVIPDTVWWLAQNGMPDYDGMLFDEDKYAKLLDRVDERRIVAVIDDLPEMCAEADRLAGRPVAIQIGTRWNHDAQFERRADMAVITDWIPTLIEQWKEENGDDDDGFPQGAYGSLQSSDTNLYEQISIEGTDVDGVSSIG